MTLAQLGGAELSRSFLSQVERGKSRISLRALAIVAQRLDLPMGYFFVETAVSSQQGEDLVLDRADAALAYSILLHQRGDAEGALLYALQAAVLALRSPAGPSEIR